jgi:hypothetical protein
VNPVETKMLLDPADYARHVECQSHDGSPASAYTWSVEHYSVAKLAKLWTEDISEWMDEERDTRYDDPEQGRIYYGEMQTWILVGGMETDPYPEPIVFVEGSDGNPVPHGIWDGWHRTAIHHLLGLPRIFAVVGRPRS